MFSYLRYFFGMSIIIILVGAVLFGWYYRMTADGIIKSSIEQNNVAIAKSFRNTVWNAKSGITQKQTNGYDKELTNAEMLKIFFMDNKISADDRYNYSEFVNFANKTRDLISDIEVAQINIYTPQTGNNKLLSANTFKIIKPAEEGLYAIGGYDNADLNVAMVMASNSTVAQSEIIHNATFTSRRTNSVYIPMKNGEFTEQAPKKVKGVLVRTLIPLRSDDAPAGLVANPGREGGDSTIKPEAVVEIFFDVTENSQTLGIFQYFSTGFIIIIFTLLYVTLLYSSRRAEKIIEKQHETNIELAQAKASAESENQQKSQFLGNISHELRTPLNAIIGFSEIVKDEVMGPINNEQYKNYIRDIHSSGVYLLSLINDILDYSKAEAGKLDIEYEEIDLSKLIISSLRLQEPRAKTAEVELQKELPQDHILVRSDAKRLRQILLNILSNAVKFTPAGGSVKISAWRNLQDNENVSIEVKDSGIGIAPKDIAKALSPFGQVDSELSRKYEGTGLGLPLTKKFIELLGGQLKLTSEVGKGTTVTVILPINNDPKSLTPRQKTQS